MSTTNVIPFPTRAPYPRPCVILHSPGWLHSGELFYVLDFLPADEDGGGVAGMWDGTDWREGLQAAADFTKEGIEVFAVDGEVRL